MRIISTKGFGLSVKCECGCLFICNTQKETNTKRLFIEDMDGHMILPKCPTCESIMIKDILLTSNMKEIFIVPREE